MHRRGRVIVAVVVTVGWGLAGWFGAVATRGPVDVRDITYRGGCGWERPAQDIPMVLGEQTAPGTRFGAGPDSLAQVVESRQVRLGTSAHAYALVRVQCSIGARTATAFHLISPDGEQPRDLGIVAAGVGPITVREVDGRLEVEQDYLRVGTTTGAAHARYRVVLVGQTPVRVGPDQDVADVPAAVARWRADTWRSGTVLLGGQLGSADDGWSTLGIQVDPATVVTAAEIAAAGVGVPGQSCRLPATLTHTGQRIDAARTAGRDGSPGAVVNLSHPADAPEVGTVRALSLPLPGPMVGLLVPGSGLVPALAVAYPDGPDAVRVASVGVTDSWLDGGTSAGAYGHLLADDGAVVFGGTWTYRESVRASDAAPADPAGTTGGPEAVPAMAPMPDPAGSDGRVCRL